MAEALWNQLGSGTWESASAGSNPAGYVHPLAVTALSELGIEIGNARSKHLDEFREQPFDVVVTVCDSAKESCPVFPHATQTLHWPFSDPADAKGTEAEQLKVFRTVRDQIRDKIASYLNAETEG
jgi:arsenate reductase